MEVRAVRLRSDGLQLVCRVHVPRGDKAFPVLCVCHGIPGAPHNPQDKGYAALAQEFCRAGFLTVIFNFRGTGESQGNLDITGWSADLLTVIDFVCSVEEADESRLTLLGFSAGAAVSIYVAAQDTRVSSLAACACPADFGFLASPETAPSTIQHFRDVGLIRDDRFPLSNEAWIDGFRAISPVQWIDRISPRPLLLVHGDADELVPLEHAHRLYQQAKEPKELVVIPGAKHRLRLEQKAMAAVLRWLEARYAT